MSKSNSDLEVFVPEGKKVTIAGKEFTVMPFVLRNRIKVVKLFTNIFLEAAKNPSFANLSNIGAITKVIEVAGEDLVNIYASVIDADKEWLEDNVQLKDEIAIIQAIVEVNDIPLILSQIQSMIQPKV